MSKIKFYNTFNRKIEEFVPINPNEVTFYACGPTVYNYAHIGNLRTFLFYDLLHRWLEYSSYNVRFVMNLTDVDDKTIKNSIAQNIPLNEYTTIYKKAFFDDMKILNIKSATLYPEATAHIDEMKIMVQTLLDKGYAYETDDGVYYRVSEFDDYGKLAHLNRDELLSGASGRVSNDEYDREAISDFALWKKWTEADGDVKWEADFGCGRPGWHLECSVMSMKYLGKTIDVHAGGVDLIFPHHENEIAQSEATSGQKFVNYWLHATHLIVDGEKMSKSKGNFYTLRDLLDKGFSARAIRFLLFTTHYRKPLNFTFDGVKAAVSSLKRIDDFILTIKNISKDGNALPEISELLNRQKNKFVNALNNDLNISEAMGAMFELIRAVNEKANSITKQNATEILAFLEDINKVLGFIEITDDESLTAEEAKLIEARTTARNNKDWAKSDEIRDKLLAMGIEVRDTADGVVWTRV